MSASNLPVPSAEPARYGEVYDRGYKHYDGPRLGRKHAFSALVRYSMQRALGIKKRWTSKIVPIILYVAVVGTVAILIGVESFLPSTQSWSYPDFFLFLFAIEGLFVATIAPEMVCSDRREHVLTLYFSRAISRFDYVLGKLAATAILTSTIAVLPSVLLWLFRQLIADAPLSALKDNSDQLLKILLAGTLISFYLGGAGLVISTFTGRKAIAVPVIIVIFAITEALAGALGAALDDRGIKDFIYFFSPTNITGYLLFKLFPDPDQPYIRFDWWAYALGMLITIAISCAIMVWRYVPED